MIDEKRTTQASRYVLGTLSPGEQRAFEDALRLDPKLELLVQQLRGTQGGSTTRTAPPQSAPPAPSSVTQEAGQKMQPPEPGPPGTPGWILWTPWLLSACFAILCAVLSYSLISSSRMLRHQTTELSGQLQQRRRELAELQRQNSSGERAAAEKATNYQQRIRELEGRLFKDIEQFGLQNVVATNLLVQQLVATNRELAQARAEIGTLTQARKALEDALETLGSRERDRFKVVRLILLRPAAGDTHGSMGAAFWSPNDQHGILAVENLPALPPTKAYQLWLTDAKAGATVSGGLLPVSAGSVRVQFTTDARVDSAQRMFVTVESALGAAAPGGAAVLAGN